MRRITAFTLTIGALVALASAAPAAAQDDLQKGPKARDAGPPGAPADFAPGDADLRKPTPAMRHRLLMAAIGTLERDEALALDGAQRQAIEAQDRLYRAALDAYREANREAYDALRPDRAGERPAMRGDGAERAPLDPSMNPEQRAQRRAAMRERMQAVRALEMKAPSSAEIDANIWGLLNPEQQQTVERRMVRIRNAAADRMRERREGERPRRGGGAALTDEQRQRIRSAMQDITPDERREFMQRVRERLRNRGGEQRPARPMEEVEVPPPGV